MDARVLDVCSSPSVVLPRVARGCSSPPLRTTRRGSPPNARGKTRCSAPAARIPGIAEGPRQFRPAVLLPYRRVLRGARPADACSASRSGCRCRPRRASFATSTRIGTLVFNFKGQPLQLAGVSRGRRSRRAVRAVLRPHERHRDLSGRALYESRPDAHRHLHRRFQHRVSPVLLLQRRYDCPVAAGGEPPALPIRAGERLRKADGTLARCT